MSFGKNSMGQSPLPKVYPTHDETYEDNPTNPFTCLNKPWFGKDGRLWLTTCTNEAGARLFTFDGYEYTNVDEHLDSLQIGAFISGQVNDYELYGHYNKGPKMGNIFRYNLESKEYREVKLPYYEFQETPLHAYSKDSIVAVSLAENTFALMTWTMNGLNTQFIGSAKLNPDQIITVGIYKKSIWFFDIEKSVLKAIEISTQEISEYPINIPLEIKSNITAIRPYWVAEKMFLYCSGTVANTFLELDHGRQTFNMVDELGSRFREAMVSADHKGNLLFIYSKDPSDQIDAKLRLKDGSYLDYSPAFSRYSAPGTISDAIAEDFEKKMFITGNFGVTALSFSSLNDVWKTLGGIATRAMIEISNQRVVILSQFGKKFVLNLKTRSIQELNLDCTVSIRFLDTWEDKVLAVSRNGLLAFDPDTQECELLGNKLTAGQAFARKGDTVAIMNQSKLTLYNLKTKKAKPFNQQDQDFTLAGTPHSMKWQDDILWIATAEGLWKLDVKTGSNELLGFSSPFSHHSFTSAVFDSQSRLWLGSRWVGVQIFDPTNNTVEILDNRDGLPNNIVATIQADKLDNMWIATYAGIAQCTEDGEVIQIFKEEDGIANNEANRFSSLTTSSGIVLFGSVDGVTIINPKQIQGSNLQTEIPEIFLSDLEFKRGNGEVISTNWFKDLEKLDQIVLPPQYPNLELQVALTNIDRSNLNRFFYRLENDQDWRAIGTDNNLELNDLKPGSYNLSIKGINTRGFESSNVIQIPVRVKQIFYKTLWFYVLMLTLLIALALAWIIRLRWAVRNATNTIREDKHTIEAQRTKLEELDKAKTRFFTNISHEFRTPLTIISGMANQIIEEPTKWGKKGGQMIKSNSERLLKLVNQILNLRKLESADLSFEMVQGNIVVYISYLSESFVQFSKLKNLDFQFKYEVESILMDYDPDRIADIVTNLVSNAIKFCESGDSIVLKVLGKFENEERKCIIQVTDSGSGISSAELPYIFERFYQVGSKDVSGEGSGIGLALVHELVEKLDGEIKVRSKLGEGSTFEVILPITNESNVSHQINWSGNQESVNLIMDERIEEKELDNASLKILVIDDNADVVALLKSILEPNYQVIKATDGIEGEKMAFELVPDFVISDVMMPGQSGIDLCLKLKTDQRTDHIPVILLTAKADKESKKTGLSSKADAYLTKPFDREELLIIIKNLLDQRALLQKKYTNTEPISSTMSQSTTSDIFIEKLNNVIGANLADEEFSVLQLCREMTLGRTQLHNKIKALTGRSTTSYLRYRRLLRSKALLKEGKLNVSEIAYAVGFTSPNYFSRSFIKEFGFPPSEDGKST